MIQRINKGTIRKATQDDATVTAPLIRLAIQDIAEALTGEVKEERILEVLADFFRQKRNRLSYENCFVFDMDGLVIGLILCYFGGEAAELDEPLAARLRMVKNDPSLTIEKEADIEDFYLDTLCVESAYSGQGIGTALIQFAEQYAKEKGYARISLVVEQNNFKAQQLYTKLGYSPVKMIVIHHHQYEYRVKSLQ